jgi:hypothetical protein
VDVTVAAKARLGALSKAEGAPELKAKPSWSRVTVEDVQVSMAEALDSIREILLRNERRAEIIKSDTFSLNAEEQQLRASLESKIMLVNDSEVQ